MRGRAGHAGMAPDLTSPCARLSLIFAKPKLSVPAPRMQPVPVRPHYHCAGRWVVPARQRNFHSRPPRLHSGGGLLLSAAAHYRAPAAPRKCLSTEVVTLAGRRTPSQLRAVGSSRSRNLTGDRWYNISGRHTEWQGLRRYRHPFSSGRAEGEDQGVAEARPIHGCPDLFVLLRAHLTATASISA
jgi:hypothetical protein